LGWRLLSVEVDECRQTARVEALGPDGVHVTLDVRSGRAMLERERRELRDSPRGRRGDRYRAAEWCTEFLGRQRFADIGEGLREFSVYLLEHAPAPLLADE